MKKLYYVVLFIVVSTYAQEKVNEQYTFDANYFYGNVLTHNKTMKHLVTAHPQGFLLSVNKKTFGNKTWEAAYNYPDIGLSFHYQDLRNQTLGELFGLYAHYNFYFLNRNLVLRVGQGIAYNTNPYDKETNFRNIVYGTAIMPSTYFMLNYNKQNLWKGFGVQAGLSLFHHSNANIKAPNTSTNTLAFNVGVNYTLDHEEIPVYKPFNDSIQFTEPIRYNVVFRTGISENDIINSGQFPFYVLSAYADKRINRKSAIQLGADVFWTKSLQEYIKFKSVAYPDENIDANTDYRKIGIFVGHELFINKISVETQLGYYVYSPFDYLGRIYERVGMKYYINDNFYGALSLKAHGAKAEALELGIGIRF
ncbi:acyloxyacyl hydrolase [Flavobacterium sp. '19STA2R22 D10 B1']|uniref:acyloxyacyl hydrolase n=1 Tax=Flavobacterium aerium TaxID=3037261 RepID=UPI00278BD9DA|nr:acyloxyacyl hydrolase [Flavobacterium sp. '19STA2R22 D10 B1']